MSECGCACKKIEEKKMWKIGAYNGLEKKREPQKTAVRLQERKWFLMW